MNNKVFVQNESLLAGGACESVFVDIDFESAGSNAVMAGTPISANGKIANDETALGILKSNAYKQMGKKHAVIISGFVDLAKAEANSGVVLTDAAKSAMVNILFTGAGGRGGGASSWNDLTDKPFGEEVAEVAILEGASVTLDDNGEAQITLDKEFDLVFDAEYTVTIDGVSYTSPAFDVSSMMGAPAVWLGDATDVGGGGAGLPFVIIVGVMGGITVVAFNGTPSTIEKGVPFSASITYVGSIVHAIDPKYLPNDEVPVFNLISLGVQDVAAGGDLVAVECDTTKMMAALEKGAVTFSVHVTTLTNVEDGNGAYELMVTVNAINMGGAYTAVIPLTFANKLYLRIDETGVAAKVSAE